MKSLAKLLTLGAALAVSSTIASATVITPSSGNQAPDILDPALVGSALDTVSGTMSGASFTSTYSESVYESTGNTGCASSECLTFEITYTNNTGDSNEAVTNGSAAGGTGFLDYTDDVGFLNYSDGGYGLLPDTVSENSDGVISFNFPSGDEVTNGDTTDTLIIETNATSFGAGDVGAIDSIGEGGAGLVPVAPTPEPSSLLLLGTGLLGAAGMLYRRSHFGSAV